MSESSGLGPEMETLRDELRIQLDANNLTMLEAARVIGVGYSTLHAWAKASYKGDNIKIAGEVKKWLAAQSVATDRRALLPSLPSYVATPTSNSFIDVLEHAQATPDLVTISGGAGIGKTSAAHEYARTHTNIWIVTARPSVSSVPAILEHVCMVLGAREFMANRRSATIVRRLIGTQGLLIVDEANHLRTEALDELRSIHDEARIGLALMGNEEIYSRLEGGGRRAEFAQLFSRIGLRMRRARPLAGDVNALADAAGVAGDAERKLLRLIASKPGALRGAAKSLRIAQMLALHDGVPMTTAHLEAAWSRLSDGAPVEEAP
jgi:DNA transposition AAA+ family ATPase